MLNKTALVFSGGGAKGAYEIGVVKALCEQNLYKWDNLYGVSIGSFNAGAFAQYEPSEQCTLGLQCAYAYWNSVKSNNDVFVSNGGIDSTCFCPLNALTLLDSFKSTGSFCIQSSGRTNIEKAIDASKIMSSSMGFKTIATQVSSGKSVTLDKNMAKTTEDIYDMMFASSAIAPVLRPWQFQGNTYVDGGLLQNSPVMQALDDGNDTVVVLVLHQKTESAGVIDFNAECSKGLAIMEMYGNIFANSTEYMSEFKMACKVYPHADIVGIFSQTPLIGTMDFSEQHVQELLKAGYTEHKGGIEVVNLCIYF